jgi:hypothetical protein
LLPAVVSEADGHPVWLRENRVVLEGVHLATLLSMLRELRVRGTPVAQEWAVQAAAIKERVAGAVEPGPLEQTVLLLTEATGVRVLLLLFPELLFLTAEEEAEEPAGPEGLVALAAVVTEVQTPTVPAQLPIPAAVEAAQVLRVETTGREETAVPVL